MNAHTLADLAGLLQRAHAGELGAALAYHGHAASVRDPMEKARITAIMFEELDHRARVRSMLDVLGVAPNARQERKMRRIGRLIGAFCRVGGWYAPMYGAGRLERNNIGEYERAARDALAAGYTEFVDDLLDMAEVEWEHERFFRTKSASHWLWKLSPKWSPPPPKDAIRRGLARSAGTGMPARAPRSPLGGDGGRHEVDELGKELLV